ncbi:phage head closure protein [Miniphocaeibacter massiliensis]|uniref:phage head closure protein n=1 Tax=Miniphocaeibacter massiliensis TaxID=2041841 RepID=UPI000C1B87A2|nr:phage head closure protein [Miniphocaeibacter massiliensis]
MNIGRLKHRIKLQKSEFTQDDWGNSEEELVEIGEVWAYVTNLHGEEYFAAAQLQLHKEVKFIIRYNPEVDEDTTITFRDKNYDITFVDNIKYGNEYMEIKGKQRKSWE